MSRKFYFFRLIFIFFAALIVVPFVVIPSMAFSADKIELRLNYPGPESPPSTHPISQGIAFFKERLEEKSEGRFEVTIYWGGALYPDDSTQYEAIRAGRTIQMGESSGGRMGRDIPETYFLELPFMFDDMAHVQRFLYGSNDSFTPDGPFHEIMRPIYQKNGYRLMSVQQYGFNNFISSKRYLKEPSDFKGLNLRIRQSDLAATITTALGATPQAIPYMETYTALSQKTVDGAECPFAVIQGVAWHETGDYLTVTRHSLLTAAWLMNPKWYDELPNDMKKILNETFVEMNQFVFETQQDLEHKMPWIMINERPTNNFSGITMRQREALVRATEPVRDEYLKRIDNPALKEALDATRK